MLPFLLACLLHAPAGAHAFGQHVVVAAHPVASQRRSASAGGWLRMAAVAAVPVQRYAVLVDAENTPHNRMGLVMGELAKYGATSIRLVYGDFTKASLYPWRGVSLDLSFRSVNAFSFTPGKGSSDAAMIIDAMDILHTNDAVDGFCLVSSDSDFTGLAQRLRHAGKHVIGVGRQITPKPFVTACDRFIYVENLGGAPEEAQSSSRKQVGVDPETLRLLRDALADCADEDGWALLAVLGASLLRRKADFDTRSFGFKKLGKLVESMPDIFEMKEVHMDKKVRERDGLDGKPIALLPPSHVV